MNQGSERNRVLALTLYNLDSVSQMFEMLRFIDQDVQWLHFSATSG